MNEKKEEGAKNCEKKKNRKKIKNLLKKWYDTLMKMNTCEETKIDIPGSISLEVTEDALRYINT